MGADTYRQLTARLVLGWSGSLALSVPQRLPRQLCSVGMCWAEDAYMTNPGKISGLRH